MKIFIGKEIMKKIIILILTITLFVSCHSQDKSFVEDNKIEFTGVNKIPVVEGTINGKKAFFIVDSGASISVLDNNQKNTYGFYTTPSDLEAAGYGGTASFEDAHGVNISIGDVRFVGDFKSQDLSKIFGIIYQSDGIEISGIIGSDIMKNYHFIIDYSDSSISLKK
jgi:predicted aspartyl protease